MTVLRGVPAVVDLAAMRDAMKRLGGDPAKINPLCPVDLVIDHSVQVSLNYNTYRLMLQELLMLKREMNNLNSKETKRDSSFSNGDKMLLTTSLSFLLVQELSIKLT